MFSKSCEYAIKAVVYLAINSDNDTKRSIGDIANAIDSPIAFTAKILQKLSANEIVKSAKGNAGGYYILPSNLSKIHLSKIVDIIDGDAIYTNCALGFKNCSEIKPCPLHEQIKKIRTDLRNMLTKTTINDLINAKEKNIIFKN